MEPKPAHLTGWRLRYVLVLGFAMVRGIVKMQRGQLTVSSKFGDGAAFHVTLREKSADRKSRSAGTFAVE